MSLLDNRLIECCISKEPPTSPARDAVVLWDQSKFQCAVELEAVLNESHGLSPNDCCAQVGSSSGAHSGLGFPLWHREFMKRQMPTRWALMLLGLAGFAKAQEHCKMAPSKDLHTTCKMMHQMDMMARKWIRKRQIFERQNPVFAPFVFGAGVSPAVPPPFAPSAEACMNYQCLCPYFRGNLGPQSQCFLSNGYMLGMSTRREYRMLSDNERFRFHNALVQLKRSGDYDRLSAMHRQVGSSSGAHSGPGFLPWHREFMKRFEIAIRLIDPGLNMPYWDSVIDSYLPDPRDSIMFTTIFMGDADATGQVVQGPFASFRTLEGKPNIVRKPGSEGKLFSETAISNAISNPDIQSILAYTAPQAGCPYRPNFAALEYAHSSVHLWIGGDMKPPTTSANDPIFFLHHTFVDYIWEIYRQTRQTRGQRETAWSPDVATCSNTQHFSYAQMRPWEKLNRDGLSNAYTDYMYRYAPRPSCSTQSPTCGSSYLFCDTRGNPHCVSKVKINGNCRGFESFDSCYQGQCVAGFCRPGQFAQPSQTTALQPFSQQSFSNSITEQTPPFRNRFRVKQKQRQWPSSQRHRAPALNRQLGSTSSNCYNDDPCCEAWARSGECSINRNYMSRYCRKSCFYCASADTRNGCVDRHVSCTFWQAQNFCTRRRQWMAENCQASCGWCNISKQQLCVSVARMSRM
ncbi:unnamed protein product, partial [Mesorhabditis belari]|uniref:ShKT domain-containing protein n=1 Tax=Mesorhabditis belari TaxID=2138241 RepID=A0AAF3J1V9_9BILA